jgi:hypothetical protein
VSEPIAQVSSDQGASRAGLRKLLTDRSLLAGVAAGAVVFAMRHEGLLVGPSAVVVVGLVFIFAPGPRRIADRVLLFFALVVGFLPLVGWVPGLETKIDVPGIFLAIATGVVCRHQVRLRVGPRAIAIPTSTELVAIAAGAAVTWWWARPWAHLSLSGTLYALFRGYDNNSHFGIFKENLQLGSFIQVRPTLPGGADRVGYDYPQGIHQTWAQFVRLLVPRPPSALPWLVHAYLDMLLLSCCGIVILGCMAVARLCRRDLLIAMPAMAIVVALFAFGRFEPFTGFMNYELAIAACAVGVTLMVRPTLSATYNFFAVAGMGLIVVYNWYPLLVLMAPALVIASLRARSECHGRVRLAMTAIIGATAFAYVLPVVFTFHRGTNTLNLAGSGIHPSWGLLILCVAVLIGLAVFRQTTHPDLTTNLIVAAPAVLGIGAVIVFAVYEYSSLGFVAHYGQKLAAGVLGVCLVVLACVVASELATKQFHRRRSLPIAAVAVLLTVAALQIDGYVGPLTGVLQSGDDAIGITVRHDVQVAAPRSLEAEQVLLAAQEARSLGAGGGTGQWWYLGLAPTKTNKKRTDFVRLALWFPELVGDATNPDYFRSQDLGDQLTKVHSHSATARIVIKDFPLSVDSQLHLFVPGWLQAAMIRQDPAWARPGLLLAIPIPPRLERDWPQ